MTRLLVAILTIYLLNTGIASASIQFFFGKDGGAVSCGVGSDKVIASESPLTCDFTAGSNQMVISRESWKAGEFAILSRVDENSTVEGKCAKSITEDANFPGGRAFQVGQACDSGGVEIFLTKEDYYNTDPVLCSDPDPIIAEHYIQCQFDNVGQVTLSRQSWHGKSALLVKGEAMTGQCAGSFLSDNAISMSYNIVKDCQSRYIKPMAATGKELLSEWYTDLPWHQKLSTKDSNLIDTPFVLPYAALLPGLCEIKKDNKIDIDEPRCMLRYGVLNIMAMQRTDTLYNAGEAPTDKNCTDCVQVKIRIQRINTLIDNALGYQADTIRNNAYTIENYPDPAKEDGFLIPSLSFALTEATIFAPWRPWYTGHYCAKDADNQADSVCYEDYFTTQLIATSSEAWLWDAPALFEPKNEKKEPDFEKFCASGLNYCDMYLGKVDWVQNPEVTDCGADDVAVCVDELIAKTKKLDKQFNASIKSYLDEGRYPWPIVKSDMDLLKDIEANPFIGFYDLKRFKTPSVETDSVTGEKIYFGSLFKGTHYVLPKQCTQENFLGARKGIQKDIDKLANCVLNFEIHTNGYYRQWRYLYGEKSPDGKDSTMNRNEIIAAIEDISNALPGINANQYGRTMFLYAGVPEQHIPVAFKVLDDGVSLYDKVYNASIYTQYLPMVNPADQTLLSKSYTDDFWHSIFMSNHMNQTPDHFIRGIRGRTLWHNEYRSNIMYNSAEKPLSGEKEHAVDGTAFEGELGHIDFPAGFQVAESTTPFHGNTCDACHIRNGSGVPLMPNGKLSNIHVARGMEDKEFKIEHDYTYSNPELPAMKMVLFDLGAKRSDGFYNNKIMNFYGDSFHVNQKNRLPTYSMKYVAVKKTNDYEVVVDSPPRQNKYLVDAPLYEPKRVHISDINIGSNIVCRVDGIVSKPESSIPDAIWPKNCLDVSGTAIATAINDADDAAGVGFMHLLGRRLGNTPMIEMVPDTLIMEAQSNQEYPGEYGLVPGTRGGGKDNYRKCPDGKSHDSCYISRWGWIGDRASLEDQIANAANVEMSMTSTESYNDLHGARPENPKHLLRYNQAVCGPADAFCKKQKANSDITEQEIKDMATYQRWIGIPNRSEYQVSSLEVQKGEGVFKELECNSCHIIKKIPFDKDDNMLPDEERKHLQTLKIQSGGKADYPFISYLGTDLLMHDMGYLSQVAKAPKSKRIRNDDGTVKEAYKAYVQAIRTPALKGLRFNRFVTDSNHNTSAPLNLSKPKDVISGCDFLLHDGRACDAIEAAYLHDGPAIKELGTIEALNNLNAIKIDQLRAFLYSL